DVPVYTATGLTPGTHTVTVTKLSGQYATLDGFGITMPTATRVNDTDAAISYSGYTLNSARGVGDFADDVHYATANGATARYSFTGSFVLVYGELNTDQGDIGVAIDGGPQQTVSSLSSDGARHTDTPVFTAAGLAAGSHTVVITKLSGQYSTLDGFGTP
ncbi:hypothetical protein ACFW1A_25290, partial [Kitasatospora sp. NPDC058965]